MEDKQRWTGRVQNVLRKLVLDVLNKKREQNQSSRFKHAFKIKDRKLKNALFQPAPRPPSDPFLG